MADKNNEEKKKKNPAPAAKSVKRRKKKGPPAAVKIPAGMLVIPCCYIRFGDIALSCSISLVRFCYSNTTVYLMVNSFSNDEMQASSTEA